MPAISQTKFAEITGRTRQAVWQKIQRGTLVALPNGQLDTENPINAQVIADIELEKSIKKNVENYSDTSKNNPEKPPEDPLAASAANAKRGQDVLKFKKLQLEVDELEGSLIRRDRVANVCFDYLSALNINIMESPQSFLDELEGAIINKSSRAKKMEIVTKPICEAIETAITQVEKKLKEALENED